MKIHNAKSFPLRFYGLHFCEGVAHYPQHKATLYIGPAAARAMDPTYEGKPIFVEHNGDYALENIESEADGWVVRSFYNKSDGNHWTEFLAISDLAKECIAKGWRLSNSYNITKAGPAGVWHDVPYDQEVLEGEGDHIAIVEKPRYEESIILTPEEFKAYNEEKERELLNVQNSKGESSMFFKKKVEKVDNSKEKELLETMVTLPKSKVEKTLQLVINEADEFEVSKSQAKIADADAMVKVGDVEMKVSELIEKYQALVSTEQKDSAENEAEGSDEMDEANNADDTDESEASEDKDLKKEIIEKAKNSKETNKEHLEELQRAHKVAKVDNSSDERVLDTQGAQLKRGLERY